MWAESFDHAALEAGKEWSRFPIFAGSTPACRFVGSHVSVLAPGATSHAPHAHETEELLAVLDGEADITLGEEVERLVSGEFVYYSPAGPPHAIRNAGAGPLTYWVLNWRGAGSAAPGALPSRVFRYSREQDVAKGFHARNILKHTPTAGLDKFHAHLTTLQPGAGYGEHVDEYDVAHLVLSGKVRTMGVEAGPWSLVYFASGEGHDMRCVSEEAAQYLVFELHGGAA